MKCKICGRTFTKNKGLAQHIRHSHNMTAKDYYLEYVDKLAGKCCVCGKQTPFMSIHEGFQHHCSTTCANSDAASIAKANCTKASFSADKVEQIKIKTRKTCTERYGGIGFASDELREKGQLTNERRHGSRTYSNQRKKEQTCIAKTGYKSVFCDPNKQRMFKQIKKERYGDENYNNRSKCTETNLKRYGTVCPANSKDGHAKSVQTMIAKSGSVAQSYADRTEKSKETKLRRYGDANYNNVEQMKATLATMDLSIAADKRKQTCLKRYQVDSYSKTKAFKTKYETTCQQRYGYKYPFAQGKFKQNYSKGEKEVVKFVQSIYSGVILEGDRKTLLPTKKNGWKAGHELDIYLPNLHIAIEYNGDYYHDYVRFPDRKIQDEKKQNECKRLGISLITIWEHEWKKFKEKTKERIRNEIGRTSNDK